jgi:methionine-gamma-lyase
VIAGIAVSCDEEYIHRLKFDFMCEFGGVISPFNAYLVLRGIKTLGLRMEKHSSNAMALARHLLDSKKVSGVYYPGLESSPSYSLCMRQMKSAGGMVSFELHGGKAAGRSFLDGLRMIKLAVSLGDVETLAEMPSVMTHRGYDQKSMEGSGFTEGMIRISVGIEDIDDILRDIDQAIDSIR